MAAVDVVASAVPSAAGQPPFAAVTLMCAYVRTAAASACGLRCVSASEEGWVLSQPACALMAPVGRPPVQVNLGVRAAAVSVKLAVPEATARGCEPD